ncbi:MAG: DUF3194 domain-containing protein [Candidatus Bathyarchaeota archaeon]|nr:DUF3194 domain-containing protein [Candidatus Bathyarchaeota archaeon]
MELGIPELTTEQIELLSQKAEEAARKVILQKVSAKLVEGLDISVEVEGTKPVEVTVEVNLVLSPQAKGVDADALVKEGVAAAHRAAENFLRKIK